MIPDNHEELADKVLEPFYTALQDMKSYNKKRHRAYIGGGLIFAISMFAMKCDNAINVGHTREQIQETRQEVRDIKQNGFYIGEPCFYTNGTEEKVEPC